MRFFFLVGWAFTPRKGTALTTTLRASTTDSPHPCPRGLPMVLVVLIPPSRPLTTISLREAFGSRRLAQVFKEEKARTPLELIVNSEQDDWRVPVRDSTKPRSTPPCACERHPGYLPPRLPRPGYPSHATHFDSSRLCRNTLHLRQ